MAKRHPKRSTRETHIIERDRELLHESAQRQILAKTNSRVRSEIVRETRSLDETRAAFKRLHEICSALRSIAERAASERLEAEERLHLQNHADTLNAEFHQILEDTDFLANSRLGQLLDQLKMYLH